MSVDLKSVLLTLKEKIGSNAHLGDELGYSEKTIQEWLSKNGDELERLSPEKKKNILTLAENYGLESDTRTVGPPLMDPASNFMTNSQRPLPQPPSVLRPFVDHRVPFLGSHIGGRVGVGPSSLTFNVRQVQFWASSGVDVITFRTVRSSELVPAGTPNLRVAADRVDLDRAAPRDVEVVGSWDTGKIDNGVLSIYYGSSQAPPVWQANFKAACLHLSGSQLLILSVLGGVAENLSENGLIQDWQAVSRLGVEASARVIELNLSAPRSAGGVSIGEQPLCCDIPLTTKVCAAVRSAVGESVKILIKIRSMPPEKLKTLVEATVGNGYADGISAVSTEGVYAYLRRGVDKLRMWGEQEFCVGGKPLLPLGLRCVSALAEIRAKLALKDMAIIGLGGVSTFEDFQAYRQNGADVVQVVSQCFADSYFPFKLRKALDDEARRLNRESEHNHDIALITFAKAARTIERWPGMTPTKKEKVQGATLDVMLEYMRRREHTSSLGPMRSKPLTLDECIRMIQTRLI